MPTSIIYLLLFGGLQGLLLFFFFARKKLHQSSFIFLALYLSVMLAQIALKVMNKSYMMDGYPFFYQLSYQLPFLYGPLLYLFTRQSLLRQKPGWLDGLHFLPIIIACLYIMIEQGDAVRLPMDLFFFDPPVRAVLQVLSLVIYHAMAFHYWEQYRKSLRNFFSETHRLQLGWIRQLIIASFVTCTIVVVSIFLLYIYFPRGFGYRYGFVALSLLIYWISFTALTRPTVFSVIKGYAEADVETPLPMLVVHRPEKKYSNAGLDGEELRRIQAFVEMQMQQQKLYLNPALTIQDLAAVVNCNRHHLSRALNEGLQQSFYDYVNGYRVGEAKALLLDPDRAGHKIAAIAYDAGFNSLSTFNDVFRKMTGFTPSQFRKQSASISLEKRV